MNCLPKAILFMALCATTVLTAVPSQAFKSANPCPWGTGVLPPQPCTNPSHPVTTSGNSKVQHPEVVLIFWQDSGAEQWTNKTNTPTMAQYIGIVNQAINSAYTAGLNQYAGSGYIARPRFSGWAPIYTGAPPNNSGDTTSYRTMQDLFSIINYEIQNGLVPPPVQYTYNGNTITDDVIYAVVAPTFNVLNAYSRPCPEGDGCNGPSVDNLGRAYVAISADNNVADFGHELIEAITQWQNVFVSNCGNAYNQVADWCLCSQGQASLNGAQTIDSYWSAADGACIIPEAWGDLLWADQHGASWVDSEGNYGLPSGGAGGIVGTDEYTDTQVFWFNNTVRTWTVVGVNLPTISELSAGGTRIALLQMDTGQRIQYATAGFDMPWSTLPNLPSIYCGPSALCPIPTPITKLVMTDALGGSWAAMDPTGEVWIWNASRGWVNANLHCDDLTAHGGDLLCSTGTQRHLIYDYAGSQFGTGGTTWSLVANSTLPIVQVVSSSDNVYGQFGFVFGGQLSLEDSYGERYAGSEFASFSLYDNGYYGGIETQEPLLQWWLNPNDAFQSFGEAGPVGRLVSGAYVYATSCSNPSGMSSTCVAF